MLAVISRLFGWLGTLCSGFLGRGFLTEVAKWTAAKLLLAAFWTTGVYIIVMNLVIFVADKINIAMTAYMHQNGSNISPSTFMMVGLMGYLAQKMSLLESFSMLISGVTLKAVRQLLPF